MLDGKSLLDALCSAEVRATLPCGEFDEERSKILMDSMKYTAMFCVVTGGSLNEVLALSMSHMKCFGSVQVKHLIKSCCKPFIFTEPCLSPFFLSSQASWSFAGHPHGSRLVSAFHFNSSRWVSFLFKSLLNCDTFKFWFSVYIRSCPTILQAISLGLYVQILEVHIDSVKSSCLWKIETDYPQGNAILCLA